MRKETIRGALIVAVTGLYLSTTSFAQDQACDLPKGQATEEQWRIECLEKQLADLSGRVSVAQNVLTQLIDQYVPQILAHGELLKKPDFIPVPEKVFATRAYWAGGALNHVLTCSPLAGSIDGYTILWSNREVRATRQGVCGVAPYCDSGGEFCDDMYAVGCYVRSDLLAALTEVFSLSPDTIIKKCSLS